MLRLVLMSIALLSALCNSTSLQKRNAEDEIKNLKKAIDDVDTFVKSVLCPAGFYSNYFGCYKFIYERLSHDDASARCRTYGGHLVELKSKEKNDALIPLMDKHNAKKNTWYNMGLKKINNVWTWGETNERPTWLPRTWASTGIGCGYVFYSSIGGNSNWTPGECALKFFSICEL